MIDPLPDIEWTEYGPMAVRSSPTLLAELLAMYERELIAQGAPLTQWLQPGLPRSEIVEQLAGEGLGAPEELVVWYGWHNGYVDSSRHPASFRVLPRFVFGSIERSLDRYRRDRTFVNSPDFDEQELSREAYEWGAGEGWLKIDDNNYGCAIDCSQREDIAPRLRYTDPEFEEYAGGPRRAVSLCTLATWWLEGLRSGAYRWNPAVEGWDVDTRRIPVSQRTAKFG